MGIEAGYSKKGTETCPSCNGDGVIKTRIESNSELQFRTDTCPTCKGSGQVPARK